MKKRDHKVKIKCDAVDCSWQFGGECRAFMIKKAGGVFECPYEDTRKLREHIPRYKNQ